MPKSNTLKYPLFDTKVKKRIKNKFNDIEDKLKKEIAKFNKNKLKSKKANIKFNKSKKTKSKPQQKENNYDLNQADYRATALSALTKLRESLQVFSINYPILDAVDALPSLLKQFSILSEYFSISNRENDYTKLVNALVYFQKIIQAFKEDKLKTSGDLRDKFAILLKKLNNIEIVTDGETKQDNELNEKIEKIKYIKFPKKEANYFVFAAPIMFTAYIKGKVKKDVEDVLNLETITSNYYALQKGLIFAYKQDSIYTGKKKKRGELRLSIEEQISEILKVINAKSKNPKLIPLFSTVKTIKDFKLVWLLPKTLIKQISPFINKVKESEIMVK